MKNIAKTLFGIWALCSLVGCGYTFQGSGSILPPDVKKIYIPMVENNSTEPSLTTSLTEALRDQFERYGAVDVVEDLNSADAVLKAKILGLKRSTNTTTSKTDTTLQQDSSISVAAELRRVSGPILWRNPKMSISQTYGTTAGSVNTGSASFAGGSISSSDLAGLSSRELSRGQEAEVLSNMVEQVAKKVYEDSVAPDF